MTIDVWGEHMGAALRPDLLELSHFTIKKKVGLSFLRRKIINPGSTREINLGKCKAWRMWASLPSRKQSGFSITPQSELFQAENKKHAQTDNTKHLNKNTINELTNFINRFSSKLELSPRCFCPCSTRVSTFCGNNCLKYLFLCGKTKVFKMKSPSVFERFRLIFFTSLSTLANFLVELDM